MKSSQISACNVEKAALWPSFVYWARSTELQERLATLEEDIQNNLPDEALSIRFKQLSERLKQLLNQPQTETVKPTQAETSQQNQLLVGGTCAIVLGAS